MSLRRALSAGVAIAISAAAFAQPDASADPAAAGAPLGQSCSAHKFETTVMTNVDGKPRSQKVKICGVEGQSDADWKRTLEDSVAKVQANDKMPAEMKRQITDALKLEIGTLGGLGVMGSTSPTTATASGATALPTIQNIPSPLTPARPATPPAPRPLERDYGNLQPLPAPPPPVVTSAVATSMLPALASPKIRVLCNTPTDPHGAEECRNLAANTVFTIRADEPLSGDTSLRFIRKGDPRGDIKLAAMRKGQSVRVLLPSTVCKGVTRTTVDIEVMRGPAVGARQVVDSLGPYLLRC